jgi:hypothetical protein
VRKLLLDLGALNRGRGENPPARQLCGARRQDVSSAKATGTEVELIAPGHTWVLVLGKPSGAKSGYVRVANSPQSLLAAPGDGGCGAERAGSTTP